MVFSIIMLVCLIVCVGIDYLSLKRIERNGALLGVTLPQNAAELPEVQDIVQRISAPDCAPSACSVPL